MPLMKYFVFVGSALVLLLLAMNWLLPDPTAEPVYSSTEGPSLRISSIETLPEKVVLDNTMPYTVVPPPSAMEVADQKPTVKLVEPNAVPKPITQTAGQDVPKKQTSLKREQGKKVAAHRAAPPMETEAADLTTGSGLALRSRGCRYWRF